MLTIRMQRGGRVHKPVYTIVSTNSRNARDGKFNEKLGQYNPEGENNLIDLNLERIKVLIGKGATVSTALSSLLKKNNISLN